MFYNQPNLPAPVRGPGILQPARRYGASSQKPLGQDLGDIPGPERLFHPGPLDPVLEHGQTEGAVGDQHGAPVAEAICTRLTLMRSPIFSSARMRPPPALQQKASARFLSISTSRPPAVRIRAARGLVDIVMAAQIAGVVVGAGRDPRPSPSAAVPDQPLEEFRVGLDLNLEAEIGNPWPGY
jgi:hypothetical protein